MLQNHFLCLFPRLWLITPNQLSVFTGCLGETSSNNDSAEFPLLLYHSAGKHTMCAGKTHHVSRWERTEDPEQSLFACLVDLQGSNRGAGKSSGRGTRRTWVLALCLPLWPMWLWASDFINQDLSFPICEMRPLNQIISKVLTMEPILVPTSHCLSHKRILHPCPLP